MAAWPNLLRMSSVVHPWVLTMSPSLYKVTDILYLLTCSCCNIMVCVLLTFTLMTLVLEALILRPVDLAC